MKDLDPIKPKPDDTAQVIQFPKTLKSMGIVDRPHIGMKLWEVDTKTGIAEECKFKAGSLPEKIQREDVESIAATLRVDFNPTKFYTWAINKRNAQKKFKQAVRAARGR